MTVTAWTEVQLAVGGALLLAGVGLAETARISDRPVVMVGESLNA